MLRVKEQGGEGREEQGSLKFWLKWPGSHKVILRQHGLWEE